MKAAFLTEVVTHIPNAYSAGLQAEMAKKMDLVPGVWTMKESAEELKALSDVEVVFSTWGMPSLNEEQIKTYLPKLKGVFYAAGSVQYFARPYLACGADVFSAWAANGVPVAEVTVSEIILAAKGFFQRFQYENGAWDNHDVPVTFPGNYNTNIGIIGAGMIGKMVIKMLQNYHVNVYVFDPFLSEEKAAELHCTKVKTLPELFETCLVVSNHLANNPQTVGMINRESFSKMAKNGVFINTGRGAQVVEADMIAAMKEEPLRVALLDVTDPEPPVPGSEMYNMRNIILTPHLAGSIGDEIQRMGQYMFEEFCRWEAGEATFWSVTEKMLETMA